MKRPLTVCFFGYGEKDEGGRAWVLRNGLIDNGITVEPCQTFVDGFLRKYRDLYRMWKGIALHIDALYVTFMGYSLMPLAWYLARRRGIPVILDTLISQYDTEVTDRKRVSPLNPRAWLLWVMDVVSCFMADAIVVDTIEHKKFFATKFFVNEKKIIVAYIGCRSDRFVPSPYKGPKEKFIVEFHGGFSSLHGVDYIVEAAKILQDTHEQIHFEIVGGGQMFAATTRLAQELGLTNIEFLGKRPFSEMPHFISRADICLGIFGTNEKGLRAIPNKIYECMSSGKPIITARSVAILEVLRDYEEVCLVEPGSGRALAEKILELKRDEALRKRLSERGRAIMLTTLSPRSITRPLAEWIESHA